MSYPKSLCLLQGQKVFSSMCFSKPSDLGFYVLVCDSSHIKFCLWWEAGVESHAHLFTILSSLVGVLWPLCCCGQPAKTQWNTCVWIYCGLLCPTDVSWFPRLLSKCGKQVVEPCGSLRRWETYGLPELQSQPVNMVTHRPAGLHWDYVHSLGLLGRSVTLTTSSLPSFRPV